MKKSVKILSAVLAVVLVFSCGVGATLAYLQKTTGPVTNTFAAKDLITDPSDFVLKEHEVERKADGTYGFTEAKKEVTENKYDRVVPGLKMPKDPFVRVKNLEDAYLFIEVCGTLPEGMTFTIDTTEWIEMEGAAAPNGGTVYVHKNGDNDYILKALGDTAEPYSFDLSTDNLVTVADNFEPTAQGKTAELKFYAYLGQATGFTYQESWNTLFDTAAKA